METEDLRIPEIATEDIHADLHHAGATVRLTEAGTIRITTIAITAAATEVRTLRMVVEAVGMVIKALTTVTILGITLQEATHRLLRMGIGMVEGQSRTQM